MSLKNVLVAGLTMFYHSKKEENEWYDAIRNQIEIIYKLSTCEDCASYVDVFIKNERECPNCGALK